MNKYVVYAITGTMSGWFLRDILFFSLDNMNTPNAMLMNKFICSKDDFKKYIFNELKSNFNPKEMLTGFNNFHIYIREDEYFLESLYLEQWNNTHLMHTHVHSETQRNSIHNLKKINVMFTPTVHVLLKQLHGNQFPNYLKHFF